MAGLQRCWKRNTGVVEMTSYGEIIKQGRKEEVVDTESGKTVKKEVGKKVSTESGKTVNNADCRSGEDSLDGKKDVDDSPVNITIKVPRNLRQYWTSRCKLEGVTMTQVLVEALIERFGKP